MLICDSKDISAHTQDLMYRKMDVARECISPILELREMLLSFQTGFNLASAPLSHPSACMLVNHGSSQQSSKEEYKPWK